MPDLISPKGRKLFLYAGPPAGLAFLMLVCNMLEQEAQQPSCIKLDKFPLVGIFYALFLNPLLIWTETPFTIVGRIFLLLVCCGWFVLTR